VDVPTGEDPLTAKDPQGTPLQALHGGAYVNAIDSNGNADCEVGQRGYVTGPSAPGGRYPPSTDPAKGGGSHVVLQLPPGNSGPTYKGIELGIDNLEDVP
jgi:hypothetical protein